MITQAARLSARHQVGHYNPVQAFSRTNRSLFTAFNVSPVGVRQFVMPQEPITPDPKPDLKPEQNTQMYTYKLYQSAIELTGGTPALVTLIEYLSSINKDLQSATWNGEFYTIRVIPELTLEEMAQTDLEVI